MAIRDKFRRAVGASQSTASSSSSSSNAATEPATPTSASSSTSGPTESPATERKIRPRTFTWRSAKTVEEKEQQQQQQKKGGNKKTAAADPREKPFTEMNLRYQEMLGSYELTFGTSHPEQLWNPDSELSPGTSRQNSIDLGRN
jgi:hypothetical protein